MGAKVNFNPATRIIQVIEPPTLQSGEWIVDLDVKIDLYSDGKEDWLASEALSRLRFPIRTVGGDTLPGGKTLGSTFFLRSDWKIRPYEGNHRFRVIGNMYSEDGKSPYVATQGPYNVFFESTLSNLVDTVSVNPAGIANAVWDEASTLHAATGTKGKELREVAQLVKVLLVK